MSTTRIFLARHASPDRNLKTIPYDIQPGPPLSPKGEKEAEALADFLKAHNIRKVYYSPFERSAKTAQIIAARNQIPAVEEIRLAEWRETTEEGQAVRVRMQAVFDAIAAESKSLGSIALVSHGGPITFLLQALGIEQTVLADYRKRFDTTNPLPPAGAWSAEWHTTTKTWSLQLVFIPPASSLTSA